MVGNSSEEPLSRQIDGPAKSVGVTHIRMPRFHISQSWNLSKGFRYGGQCSITTLFKLKSSYQHISCIVVKASLYLGCLGFSYT